MHEATIASNLLDIVAARVAQHPNTEAIAITVLVGAFRNVEPDALAFAFDALKEERDGCGNCELVMERVPLLARCANAGHVYEPLADCSYRCACGSGMGEVIHGQELDVVSCTLQAIDEEQALCTK